MSLKHHWVSILITGFLVITGWIFALGAGSQIYLTKEQAESKFVSKEQQQGQFNTLQAHIQGLHDALDRNNKTLDDINNNFRQVILSKKP